MKTKKQYDKNDFIMTLLKGRTFIVLIILVVLFSVLSENFFSTSTLLMVAKHVALYGILAIGMTYVIITGGIDLSVGSMLSLSACILAVLSESMNPWIAMIISLLAAYGIPCFKYYDLDGGAGKVINGFSGYGASLYVPEAQLEEAKDLLASRPVEDEETEEHA